MTKRTEQTLPPVADPFTADTSKTFQGDHLGVPAAKANPADSTPADGTLDPRTGEILGTPAIDSQTPTESSTYDQAALRRVAPKGWWASPDGKLINMDQVETVEPLRQHHGQPARLRFRFISGQFADFLVEDPEAALETL